MSYYNNIIDNGLRRDIKVEKNKLMMMGDPCDICLLSGVNGAMVMAHRSKLEMVSRYFRNCLEALLIKEGAQDRHPLVVKMTRVHGHDIQALVHHSYTNSILSITKNNVYNILCAAASFQFDDMVNACVKFLKKRMYKPSVCLKSASLAEHYKIDELARPANSIIFEQFEEISQTEYFSRYMSVDLLAKMIARKELPVKSEEVVFEAVRDWIEYDESTRREHCYRLLQLVRLRMISQEYLSTHVARLCTKYDCLPLLLDTIKWHFKTYKLFVPAYDLPLNEQTGLLVFFSEISRNSPITMELYCPTRDIWTFYGKMDTPLTDFCTVAYQNQLFFLGGRKQLEMNALDNVECFDVLQRRFKSVKQMLTARTKLGAGVLDDFLYVVGGTNKTALKSVERFDNETGNWKYVASMPTAKYDMSVAALDGLLYIVGGVSDYCLTKTTEAYNPNTNEWYTCADLNNHRTRCGIAAFKGMLYAVGGDYSNVSTSVERYDPTINCWTEICTPVGSPSNTFCSFYGDRMIIVNGSDVSTQDKKCSDMTLTVDEYDIKTGEYTPISERPEVDERQVSRMVGMVVMPSVLYW